MDGRHGAQGLRVLVRVRRWVPLCARSVCSSTKNCDHPPVHIIAVDWSGRAEGPEESLWRAEVRHGRLTELRNGLGRGELIAKLLELGEAEPRMVIGLDFAFSFPAWWCEENDWSSGEDVWSAMGHEGEDLLEGCEDPFWGRPGKRNPHPKARLYRQTERSEDAVRPKSVFQIGGAGAVGTGSIRGMPHLLMLAKNGFGIWPFSEGWPRVVEIYPRALTGPVNKSRWSARHDLSTRALSRAAERPSRAGRRVRRCLRRGGLRFGHERTRSGVASPRSAGRPRGPSRGEDLAAPMTPALALGAKSDTERPPMGREGLEPSTDGL